MGLNPMNHFPVLESLSQLSRVGWVDGSIVNPTNAGRLEMLGCQKDGNPTYNATV